MLYNRPENPKKTAPSQGRGSPPSSNTWFYGPMSQPPNSISNGSDTQTQTVLCVTCVTIKVTIRPRFCRTVHIFNDVSCQKNHGFPGCPFVPFLTWCPRFARFAYLCSSMLTHRCPKISSDFICIYEKIAGEWGSALDPAG